jgi:thioredoxin 1
MLEQIDGGSFDARVRQAPGPVVVDFFGKTCPPCAKLLPLLEQVAVEFEGQASFVKVDVEDAEDVASQLGISVVPTVIFFRDGSPVDKLTGFVPKAKLASRVAELVS